MLIERPPFTNSWCSSEENGVVITGYTQEGTLARKLLTHPEVVEDMRGQQQPLKCSVESISFSAHVDYRQNEDFMRRVRAPIVVLVHGEQNQMAELKRALVRTIGSTSTAAGGYGANILTPDLCTDMQLTIPQRKHARVLGSLAAAPVQAGQALSAVLVQSRSDFSTRLLSPEDLAAHTQLRQGGIHQRVHFPFHQTRATLLAFLAELFDDVQLREGEGVAMPAPQPLPGRARAKAPEAQAAPQQQSSSKVAALVISQCVTLFLDEGKGKALMEWETGTCVRERWTLKSKRLKLVDGPHQPSSHCQHAQPKPLDDDTNHRPRGGHGGGRGPGPGHGGPELPERAPHDLHPLLRPPQAPAAGGGRSGGRDGAIGASRRAGEGGQHGRGRAPAAVAGGRGPGGQGAAAAPHPELHLRERERGAGRGHLPDDGVAAGGRGGARAAGARGVGGRDLGGP